MRRILLRFLISGSFLGIAIYFAALVGNSQTPQSYALVCRGTPNADISSNRGRLMMKFIRGTAPADQRLARGECSWMDRGMYPTEPDLLIQAVPEGVADRPEFQWASELREPDTYWTFDVYNDRQGQLVVTGSRRKSSRARPTTVPPRIGTPNVESNVSPAAANASASASESEVKGLPTSSGLVTWTYYRMQRPSVIEQAALAVRAGKVPIEIASGINLSAPDTSGPIPARPKSNRAESVARSGSVVSNAGTMMTPLVVEHTPAKLEMGSVWDGGILQRSVFLTSPTDGDVQVKVPPDTPFRIAKVLAYDGTAEEAQADERTVARFDRADHDVTVKPGAIVVRDLSSGGRGVMLKTLGVSAVSDTPPFTLHAKSGQQLKVIVAFEPRLTNRNWAGSYDTNVSIQGTAWRFIVPAHAVFKGADFGPWISIHDPDVDVIASSGSSIEVNVPIKMINGGPAESCTVAPEILPKGVMMKPFDLSLGENSNTPASLHFVVDLNYPTGAAIVPGQDVVVRLDWRGGSKLTNLTLNLFDYFHHWGWNGEVGGLDIAYDMSVYSNGKFVFYYSAANDNLILERDFAIRFYVNDVELANVSGTADRNSVVAKSVGWVQGYIRDNYPSIVRGGPHHWIKVKSR
jgi:hypothetical protein